MIKTKNNGFTVVELVIVVVIIGIISTIGFVQYSSSQKRSRDAIRQSHVSKIVEALETYYVSNGRYPNYSMFPGPGRTGSTIPNTAWFNSSNVSWDNLFNLLKPYIGDTKLVDPINTNTAWTAAGVNNYNYSYFSGGYCGVAVGQMYILVYRLESGKVINTLEGECLTNPLNLYGNNSSNYRVVRR